MKKYICTVCDWVYDPEVGDPEGGIAPGRFHIFYSCRIMPIFFIRKQAFIF